MHENRINRKLINEITQIVKKDVQKINKWYNEYPDIIYCKSCRVKKQP